MARKVKKAKKKVQVAISPVMIGPSEAKPAMPRKEYEEELRRLQAELCKMQEWVKQEGKRIVVVFEGRDAAGKGGAIKRIVARVSPRVFRIAALPIPSDREKTQLYLQRYIQHLGTTFTPSPCPTVARGWPLWP